MTRFAHRQGIPILVVTDNQASPLAELGKVAVYAHARRSFSSTSDAAILAVLEALVAGVANRKPDAASAAQKLADAGYAWFAHPEAGETPPRAIARATRKKDTQ